ncbi:hypothetical protein V0R50_10160 [Pseudomonas sp. 148P]|uniref:Uncharacterized protein n=1 Tax=Pseudomonas ulcerans TaxID=3115852 RepID=A0ABU7HQ00_9PSED|nr:MULTISPECIES: hypothetical protein [unclassified Pseudomonas]MEE1922607.1 hypothetical protein [Pseudomonas sp. 147P]MEE1933584.1 hypothetical protein [Pseudomonas sp. 148P]
MKSPDQAVLRRRESQQRGNYRRGDSSGLFSTFDESITEIHESWTCAT